MKALYCLDSWQAKQISQFKEPLECMSLYTATIAKLQLTQSCPFSSLYAQCASDSSFLCVRVRLQGQFSTFGSIQRLLIEITILWLSYFCFKLPCYQFLSKNCHSKSMAATVFHLSFFQCFFHFQKFLSEESLNLGRPL